MTGEIAPIYIGMSFGTVSSKLSELSDKAKENNVKLENFKFKPYKKLSYKRFNETICFKDMDGNLISLSKEVHTVKGKKIFDYEYNDGNVKYFGYNRKKKDETFDTIVAGKYIAHDKNHNGIVDDGEIELIA